MCAVFARFIPARAGIGSVPENDCSVIAVHPRSCGDRPPCTAGETPAAGSSPLVRGSGSLNNPAATGCPVHPRSCGDRALTKSAHWSINGSSPLVRGSVAMLCCDQSQYRFIPARAGIGSSSSRIRASVAVHPRSCGDRKRIGRRANIASGSSPLVRGSDVTMDERYHSVRFIPARAGIGVGFAPVFQALAVHPRSCGDRS